MLYYLATILYVLVCFVLILVILLQQGKGGDIASAFGGGGGSQAAFGARSGATVLSRTTAFGAVLFIVGALVLGILGQSGPGSVVGGRIPEAAVLPTAPATPPAAPAPAAPAAPPAAPAPAPAQ
jgi:preprotein translocase subunit SecG